MNTESGQTRNYWIGGQSLYGNAGQDLIYRFQRVSPMAISPHNPNVLYYGSQYLHRTVDKRRDVAEDLARTSRRSPSAARGRAASRSRAT